MLSVVAWDGEAGNGLWHDPVNWRDELGSDVLPGPGDDVVIDVPGDITAFRRGRARSRASTAGRPWLSPVTAP